MIFPLFEDMKTKDSFFKYLMPFMLFKSLVLNDKFFIHNTSEVIKKLCSTFILLLYVKLFQTVLLKKAINCFQTLYAALKQGSLNTKYFHDWLNDTCTDLIKLEQEATPSGWLLQWDR